MPKKAQSLKWLVMCLSILVSCFAVRAEAGVIENVQGKILLQVEGKGEAWYVYPVTGERYYLGTPEDAWKIMKQLSVGVSDVNLEKIPIAKDSGLPKGWNLENMVRKFFEKKSLTKEANAQTTKEEKGAKVNIAAQSEKTESKKAVQAKNEPNQAANIFSSFGSALESGSQLANSFKNLDLKNVVEETVGNFDLENLNQSVNIDAGIIKALLLLIGAGSFVLMIFGRKK